MSDKTQIEWTDATWNPIRGCSRVSEGCRNCYAEKVAYRFSGPGQPYEGLVQIGPGRTRLGDHDFGDRRPHWNGSIRFVEECLLDPLKWKRPRRIFVNSMSDLFHENVTDEMRDRIFAVMALCPQHTFQVLTKRPDRMLEYFNHPVREALIGVQVGRIHLEHSGEPVSEWSGLPMPNVWLGVSIEDQETANKRIPLLLKTPAAMRFISAEPLLGPISLDDMIVKYPDGSEWHWSALGDDGDPEDDPDFHGAAIGWTIAGGESGPDARPMHPDWARSLRDQCTSAGVPFFFKQWGEWTPGENVERNYGMVRGADYFDGKWTFYKENLADDEGHVDDEPLLYRVGKKSAGRFLDGREWNEFPGVRQ